MDKEHADYFKRVLKECYKVTAHWTGLDMCALTSTETIATAKFTSIYLAMFNTPYYNSNTLNANSNTNLSNTLQFSMVPKHNMLRQHCRHHHWMPKKTKSSSEYVACSSFWAGL
jgi:hypothetical protein